MNRIYRLVWNRALRIMQVASELAHAASGCIAGDGAAGRSWRPTLTLIAFALTLLICSVNPVAWGSTLPGQGGDIHAGMASGYGAGGASNAGGAGGALPNGNPGSNGNGGNGGNGGQGESGGQGGTVGGTVTSSTTISAATGGTGGQAGSAGSITAGGGGGGGTGVYVSANGLNLTTATAISGGNGGNGGSATYYGGGAGGGGNGVTFASGGTLFNSGSIVGGAGGAGGGGNAALGFGGGGGGGGHGVAGANLTIHNSGTIAGGSGGTGGGGLLPAFAGAAGAAVQFTGGTNTLDLATGSVLNGVVWLTGGANATVAAQNAGLNLGSGILLDSGTALTLDTTTAGLGISGGIDGSGSIVTQGGNALTLGSVNAASLTASNSGLTLNGNVTTSAAQHYGNAVLLGNNVTLATTNNAVTFDSTVDNATATKRSLTINAGTGGVTFIGAVGSGANGALLGLTTNSGTFSAGGDVTINGPLSVTTTAGSITQAAGVFTVSGTSTFNAGNNAITLTNAGNYFIGAVSLTGGTTQITNSGNLTLGSLNTGALAAVSIAGALNLGSGTVAGALSATSNGSLDESGGLNVTGLASFTQNGSGANVDLSGANDFHGGVTISGASINNLSLTNIDAAPGTLTLPASVTGNLTLNYTNAALTVPVVGVGGAMNVSAANGITINGNVNTGLGQTYNNAVTLGADATLASIGSGGIDFISTVDGAYNLTVNTGGVTTFGGAVGGTTALTSLTTGAAGSTTLGGNVTTMGAQAYNDTVTLSSDATLTSTGGGAIDLASTVNGAHHLSVSTGGAAIFGGAAGGGTPLTGLTTNSGTFSANALTIGSGGLSVATTAGGITQGGAFTVVGASSFNAGANAITLVNAGNDFAGPVSLTGGNASLLNNAATTLGASMVSGTLAVNSGGALTQTGAITVGTLTGSSVGDTTLIAANQIGTLGAFNAGGNFNLTNAQSLIIGSTLSAANVALNDNAGITVTGAIHATGGTTIGNGTSLQIGNGGSSGSITGNVLDNGALVFNQNSAGTFAGAISGSGSLTQSGTGVLTLSGTNTYGGGTTILAGTLQGDTSSLQGNIANNGTLAFNQNAAGTFAGAISGSGSLVQQGSGTVTLDGNSSAYTGSTDVQSGALIVGSAAGNGAALGGNVTVDNGATLGGHGSIGGNVDVASGAHLAPGNSIGTLTIGGNATFAQGSVLDYEFGASGANFQTFGTGDSVKIGGNLALNGAVLNVTDAGGFGPGLYNLFTYGGGLTETNGGIALGTTPTGDALVIQNLTAGKQINLLNTTGMTLNLWNGNGLASAAQMGGGNGTWTATSPNWTDATGSVSAAMQPQPGFAIFAGTPGTVTVDNGAGNVSATGLQFASNGYALTGGTLSLVGSSGSAPIIRVGDGSTAGATYIATINNAITGSDGLTKSDLGTLVLTGANTYAGGTTINGGTLEAANNSALGSGGVTVDNTANQGATLKVDGGITLANTIAINSGGALDNAGTISHTGATDIGVNATGGMATVTNHNGGNIAGGVIGLWLHTGGNVLNTGSTSSISGINYAVVTDGSPSSVINQLGASIHSSATDAVLMIQGGTLTNDSGASISGNVGVRMSQVSTVTNQGGASISGTTNSNGTGVGVVLHQGGTITNQGGASIAGTGTGIALQGNSTVINAAGSSISGPDASVSVFGSGAVNLTNAGTLTGNVLLGAGELNSVTLLSGSMLTGALNIGGNAGSQLTLDGIGSQLYSTAVTGATNFAGTLTKQGSGSWIVDHALAPTNTVISAGILQIGNGGSTGSLAGNITDNAALVSNLSSAGMLAGAISGTGSLTQNGSGVLTLSGANSYTGGTAINAGSVSVGNNRALGTGTVNMAAGTTVAFAGSGLTLANAFILNGDPTYTVASGNTDTLSGVIADGSTPGELVLNGGGTLVLTGANTYTGGTTISAGTLQLGNGGTSGSISGNVTDSGTLAFDHSDAVSFAGVISGSGALVQNGSGALTLAGANSYTGGTTINAGTLQGDSSSLQGNIADNATLVFNQTTAGIYAGAISGTGLLTKAGTGTLTFNGSSPFNGATTVTSGKLVVGDDSHAGASVGGTVTVASSATLGGIGTIGGLNLAGTVTPGNSIGTLHVAGDATFQQGSSYQIEAAPNGSSDQIAATGKVTILGGSAVVLAQAGNWAPRTDYTIITGAQGVSGQFASTSSSLPFLNPVLSYTANTVNLSLQRNDISFASVAQTPNQRAVATVADSLGFVSPMYSALTTLDAPTARHAFDQLSGAIHAGTSTALVDDSRYVRDAINRHLLDGTEGTTAQGVSVWASAWGHGGRHDDDGNAGSLQANGSGLLVGADLPLGSNSRLGAVVGHGQNSIRSDSLGSSAHVLGDHVGLYGSSSFGAFVLRGGIAYARQDVHSNRAVAFGSYNDWLSSEHHAQTAQAYVEGGYQFNVSPGQQLEPFVNVARVRVHSDALQEGGGNAALAVAGNSVSVNTATLGLRDTLTLDAAGGIHAHASLGWQQAWGDLTPVTTMRFVTGGNSFAVAGTPVARHALTADIGIDFKVARNVSVDASYLGQFAGGVQDQGARMSLTITF